MSIDWPEIDSALAGLGKDVVIRLSCGRTVLAPPLLNGYRHQMMRDFRRHLGAERTLRTPYRLSSALVKWEGWVGWYLPVAITVFAIVFAAAYRPGALMSIVGLALGLGSGLMMLRTAKPAASAAMNITWGIFGMVVVPVALCVYVGCTGTHSSEGALAAIVGSLLGAIAGILLVHAANRQTVLDLLTQAGTPWSDPDDSGCGRKVWEKGTSLILERKEDNNE